MTKVDSKGRIVLPQRIRERLGISPGTEVEVKEEDGKAVVRPEDDPERILDRMDELIDGISDDEQSRTPYSELGPQAKDHLDTIREQASRYESESDDE
ncbi:AbrB/MazE/SpoVT family DNA-binding domain-containing protein [Haladaptatus sp.]|uniref:AbrB/MazE/SpoVT family DNA-binding domain-containing protein n=1 Tax=Haladaptatus sp. TaxID=1973141 RepID=UPI003C3FD465